MGHRPGIYIPSKVNRDESSILLNPNLDRLIRRNGLEAEILLNNKTGEMMLRVTGTRGLAWSPECKFPITQKEMAALMGGGMSSTDMKAYKTFNSIIRSQFDPPLSMEYAKVGIGDRGFNQDGLVMMGATGISRGPRYMPRVSENVPGLMKATRSVRGYEVPSAGYIYKMNLGGNLRQQATKNIQMEIKEDKPKAAERPADGLAKKLDGTAKSAGNDTFLQLKEVLATHGIDIDEKKKVMYIRPLTARVDVRYNLKDEDLKILTANNWRAQGNMEKRLEVINGIIGQDFNEKITRQMLNEDKNYVNLTFTPDAKEYYEKKFIDYDKRQALNAQVTEVRRRIAMDNDEIDRDEAAVNGYNIEKILPGKAFFANQRYGRQLLVGEIRVDRVLGNANAYKEAMAQHELVKHYGITKDMVNSVENRSYAYDAAMECNRVCKEVGITKETLGDSNKLAEIKEKISDMTRAENSKPALERDYDRIDALHKIETALEQGNAAKYTVTPKLSDFNLTEKTYKRSAMSLDDRYSMYKIAMDEYHLVKEFGITKAMDDVQKAEIIGKINEELENSKSRTLSPDEIHRVASLEVLKKGIEKGNDFYLETPEPSSFAISKDEAALMEIRERLNKDILKEGDVTKKAQLVALRTNIEQITSGATIEKNMKGLESPNKRDYPDEKTKYTMTAMINGEQVTRTITEDQFRKFKDKSDASRLKYFAEIFSDKVDLYKADYVFKNDVIVSNDKTKVVRESDAMMAYATSLEVDPTLLKEFKANKGWYAEKGDRQKDVRNIRAMEDPIHPGKYKITAIIDSKNVSYEMSAKDFKDFKNTNDLGRMKLFAKISPDVEIKTDPDKKISPGRALALVVKSVTALAMGPEYWRGDYGYYGRGGFVDVGYYRHHPADNTPHKPLYAEDVRVAADAQVKKAMPAPVLYEMAMNDQKVGEGQIQQQSQGRGMG